MFPETWQLLLALLAACLIGLSKTGIAGLGILVAALFANLMPAKLSSGFVLPMLILGDLVAVFHYRRHADWRQVLRLFPWTLPGLLLGFLTFGRIDDHQARVLIGGILALMVAWHLLRKGFAWRSAKYAAGKAAQTPGAGSAGAALNAAVPAGTSTGGASSGGPALPTEAGWLQVSLLGIFAGFTTLIANAAGPLMNLYLLAMRMPKLEFVGTAAVFFCALNLVKVPLMVSLGSINAQSLLWNLALAPAVLLGSWLGRLLLRHIPQHLFEYSALALSAAAAVRMLLG